MSAVEELIKTVALDIADDILAETTIDQSLGELEGSLDELGIAPDDGIDPVVPTGITVTAGARALFVSWAPAPPGDRVATTEIEVKAGATVVRLLKVRHDDGAAYVDQLEANAGNTVTPAQHSVRVKHVDRYGRSSGWVGPILATPDPTFVDELKADTIIAGKIEALVSVVSGGVIAAGGARMDSGGLELTETADELSAPDVASGSKITPSGFPTSAINFFSTTVEGAGIPPKRGVHVRADGNSSQFRRGQVRVEATGNGAIGGVAHALLLIQGGVSGAEDETFVRISPLLTVQGKLRVVGDETSVEIPANSISSTEISGLSVNLLNGGGSGLKIDADLLPGIDVRTLTGGGVGANLDPDLLPDTIPADNLPNLAGLNGNLSGTRIVNRSINPSQKLSSKVPWGLVSAPSSLVYEGELAAALDKLWLQCTRNFAKRGHKH